MDIYMYIDRFLSLFTVFVQCVRFVGNLSAPALLPALVVPLVVFSRDVGTISEYLLCSCCNARFSRFLTWSIARCFNSSRVSGFSSSSVLPSRSSKSRRSSLFEPNRKIFYKKKQTNKKRRHLRVRKMYRNIRWWSWWSISNQIWCTFT